MRSIAAVITIDYTGPQSLSDNKHCLLHVSKGVKATTADIFQCGFMNVS